MPKGKKYGSIELSFQAKIPYKTWSLVIQHPENKPPEDIINSFKKLGWSTDDWVAPPTGGIATSTIFKEGRGVFRCWTPRQQCKFMEQAIMILDELGFQDVPKIKLQFHDII